MSYQNASLPIQVFIDRYGNLDRTYNVFDFITAASNTNSKITLDPNTFLVEPGKKREVKINYFPVRCDVEGSCDTALCDAADEILQPKQMMFDITRCIASKKYGVRKEDVRLTDNSGWNYEGIGRAIVNSILPEMRRAQAIDYTTYLYQLSGVHPDGNPQKRVTTTNPTNGIVNPLGMLQVQREYMDAGFSKPLIYGGSEVYNWQQMVGIGGLNAQGQLINRVNTAGSYYDDGLSDLILNDAINGGHILSIAPETFKFVWYLENAGIFRTDMASIDDMGRLYTMGTDGFMEGQFIDPITGIPWDLYINYDKCTHQWTIQIKHRYNFFVLPDIVCSAQGVNGLMRWRTCPEVIAPCPTGIAPSTPVTPTSYSWTPGDILPLNIFASVIGGIAVDIDSGTTDGILVTTLSQLAAYMNDNYTGGDTLFTVSGSNIVYSGFTPISGTFNGGSAEGGISFTFV